MQLPMYHGAIACFAAHARWYLQAAVVPLICASNLHWLQFALTGDRKLLEETERRVQRLLSHQEAAAAAGKNRELWEASCLTQSFRQQG